MKALRHVPDSIFARLYLAIMAAVAVALAIVVALIVHERRQLTLIEGPAGGPITILEAGGPAAAEPSALRRQVLEQLKASKVLFRLEEPPRPALQTGGGEPGSIDVTLVLAGGDRALLRMPLPKATPPPGMQIFVQLAVVALALAAVLFAMTRTITRPLAELMQAANAVGQGRPSPAMVERGAGEIRALMRAFNTMQERLHRYLDSRTQVLAAMSHDLRTPLTRLRLRAESVTDDATRAALARDIDEMSEMVRGALSAFRGLNHEEDSSEVDVHLLLTGLLADVRALGHEATLTGAAPSAYPGRPLALKRCLVNLIDNALQHGTQVDVTLAQERGALVVTIGDDGPGIPEPLLERVFEPFFRLESSRNHDAGGVGLGLCIARDIAQAHGGTLTLRNRAAGGLEATLRLPGTA